MRKTNLLILTLVILANVVGWGLPTMLRDAVPPLGDLRGLSFSPYRVGQSPIDGVDPSVKQVDEDLARVRGLTNRVRTYSSLGSQGEVARLAQRYGMTVTAGAWIDKRAEHNEDEVNSLIRVAKQNPNIDRVLVGNESILRKEATVPELIRYLRRVRMGVQVPVSTAETWDIWLKNPALANEVDYIGVHVLPYWEGLSMEESIPHILDRMAELQRAFPNKPIVLTEVGWPTNGRVKRGSVASAENQAKFLHDFRLVAKKQKIDYFVIEAFDQPWKLDNEGAVGAYWGLYDLNRKPKIALANEVAPANDWPVLAVSSSLLALFPLIWFLSTAAAFRMKGRLFFAAAIQGTSAFVVWAAYVACTEYQTPVTTATWVVLALFLVVLLAYLLFEAFDAAELLWKPLQRHFPAVAPIQGAPQPKVSIHLPCYNEPPEMVMETLRALDALDYPNFEVMVIDNNTKDPAVWEPVRAYCEALGEKYRFFHLDHCPGFKAGALNYVLERTAPDAEIVAVIDSDYIVTPDWLKNLVPYFVRPEVALVQAPQDYRDFRESTFKQLCNWEYAGFFHTGMVQRNERNAIIEHGTMSLIRKTALQQVGGWGEWCICEDAELGLRFFEQGWDSVYTSHSYGQGLIPDTFAAYKSQRFRWAYGAVQIMKKHARELMTGAGTKLTAWQRYYFIAGWAPWLVDGVNVLFTALALFWTAGLIFLPNHVDVPRTILMAAPLAMFAFKTAKMIYVYRVRLQASWRQSLGAVFAATALSHAIARAVISGVLTSNKPFMRTPKCENQPAIVRALVSAWEECVLLALLVGGAVMVARIHGVERPESWLWVAVLCSVALPYACAMAMAVINAWPALNFLRRPASVLATR